MQQLTFSININATQQAVWNTLWNDTTYRQWTAIFHEGSHAVSTWQEGARIDFLGPDGSGMFATIVKKDVPNLISFLHHGEIKNQQENLFEYQDGFETYILESVAEGETKLTANMNMPEAFVIYFEDAFPKALQKVKELAEASAPKRILVATTINATIEKVWAAFTNPTDIEQWNFANSNWHCPKAINDVKVGGKFIFTMAAKDDSFSFNFNGIYTEVIPLQSIKYAIEDGRKVSILFEKISEASTQVTEVFEMENENSEELQRDGWQAILENFKQYAEAKT